MGRGRPRKPSAVRHLEGNRSREPIPPDMPLQGLPSLPDALAGDEARDHFRRIAGEFAAVGFLKRADTDGLRMLAMAWQMAVSAYNEGDVSAFAKAAAAWHKAADDAHAGCALSPRLQASATSSSRPARRRGAARAGRSCSLGC